MSEKPPADPLDKSKMSFRAHLEELRTTLFKCLFALALGTLVGLMFGKSVVNFIQTPIRTSLKSFYRGLAEKDNLVRINEQQAAGELTSEDPVVAAKTLADEGMVPGEIYIDPNEIARMLGQQPPNEKSATLRDEFFHLRIYRPLEKDTRLQLISLQSQEGFMVYVKASLVVGAMISSPFLFYFIWSFVAAGLYHHERKYIYVFLPISLGLFFSGAALAFFVVIHYVLDFLFWFNSQMGISPMPQISDWVNFVLILPLGFGISFQLPLVMLFLERIHVFTVEIYLEKWRIAVLVICVLSMFLTPADPGSMLLMAIPLIILYFGGIGMCHYMPRGMKSAEEETEKSGSKTTTETKDE